MARTKLSVEFTASDLYEMDWAWILRFRGITKGEENIIIKSLTKMYGLSYMRGYNAALKCTKNDTIQAETEFDKYFKNTG